MASILPMDELNRLNAEIRERFGDESLEKRDKREEEDIIDELLDLFLLAYATGNSVTNDNLSSNYAPSVDDVMKNDNLSSNYAPSVDDVMKVVDAEVAGKTWRKRVEEYFSNGGTGADLARIADTEMHRIANAAALETARRNGARTKTWVTMMDDRVRDSHDYLLGQTVDIDEDFYTWDGAHAPAPGMFGVPEEDCNCRCECEFN